MSQLKLKGATSGDVTLKCADVAGTTTATFPATTGNVVTTGDTDTVTSAMLTDNIDIAGTLDVTSTATFDSGATISGNVGIGTTSPSAKLHSVVSDGEAIRASASGVAQHVWSRYVGGSGNPADLRVGVDSSAGGIYGVAGGGVVWNAGNSPLGFGTNNTERMRITSGGNVGIGVTSPLTELSLPYTDTSGTDHGISWTNGTIDAARIEMECTGTGFGRNAALKFSTMTANTAAAERLRIEGNGRTVFASKDCSIGFTSALNAYEFRLNTGNHSNIGTMMLRSEDALNAGGDQVRFVVSDDARSAVIGVQQSTAGKCGFVNIVTDDGQNGILWVDNNDVLRISNSAAVVGGTGGTIVGSQTSDSRLKDSITDYTGGLSLVNQLRPVNFKYINDTDRVHAGFIAQEVQSIIPESVYDTQVKPNEDESADNLLAMQYVEIIPALVNSIKELSAQVDTLKTKVAALEAKVETLEAGK